MTSLIREVEGKRATHKHALTEPEEGLEARYGAVRRATEQLCAPLSAEDCALQSMREASPAKWHLAHTSWFFETFILEKQVADYRLFHPQFRVLFNSYYNAVGPQHPRPRRGFLTRPSLQEVLEYRAHVDRYMWALFEEQGTLEGPLADGVETGLHHEQQHQELILTDIKHLFSFNPLHPVYEGGALGPADEPRPLTWHRYAEGVRWLGDAGGSFAFDNERPRHRVFVESFELASRPVSNAEFLAFIEEGGYTRPELWLSDGWDVVRAQGWQSPLYWEHLDGAWQVYTLSGLQKLQGDEPVCHLSYYEADAFACWAGMRLPTEAEWEVAAGEVPLEGNFVERRLFHPAPVLNATLDEVPQQMFGDVWEWTQSPYQPYPGYRPPAGALGEYNGKFMCNQMVLRGGSCVTPCSHIRASYRNFFPPDARWQFSGLRLARNV